MSKITDVEEKQPLVYGAIGLESDSDIDIQGLKAIIAEGKDPSIHVLSVIANKHRSPT